MSDSRNRTRRATSWIAAFAASMLALGSAHAERTFSARFVTNDNGTIEIIGNTVMSCTQGTQNPPTTCAASVPVSGTGATGANLDDNNYAMRLVNTAGGTNSSSSANLTLQPGSSILWAGLYWGADTSGGTNGSGAPNPSARNQARFSVPGGVYQNITASQVDDATAAGQANRYSAFANVTTLVQAGGAGTYRFADLQAGTGADRYAGWSLVVVVGNDSLPVRNLSVFDGLQTVRGANPTVNVAVSGFLTPLTGTFTTQAGAVVYEGDLGQVGDQFQINGTNLSNALNPANNVFNSSITRLGTAPTAKSPNFVNQMGFDADVFDASGILANGATGATLTFTTGGETYYPAVLTFANDIYQPVVEGNVTKTVVDLNGGSVQPGDVLEYTINVSNSGNDGAVSMVLNDPVPTNTTYVAGSLAVASGANAGAKTDATGDDQGNFSANTAVFRLGTGANATVGGALAVGQSTSVKFRVAVNAGVPATTVISNQATVTYNGATVGTPFTSLSDGDPNVPGNQPTTVIVGAAQSRLAISKSGTPDPVLAGQDITYTLHVVNSGPGDATNVVVSDPLAATTTFVSASAPAGWTTSAPAVGANGTVTFSNAALPVGIYDLTVVAKVIGSTPGGTVIGNTATATASNDPTGPHSGATNITVAAAADLAITKTDGSATYTPGNPITYTIVASNAGPSNAVGATVADTLPPAITGATWTVVYAGGATGPAGGSGNINATVNLPSGGSATFTVTGTVSAGATGNLSNTATITPPSGTTDPNAGNNSATDTDTAAAVADVAVAKSGPASVGYGGSISYSVVVSNNGPSDANGTTFADSVPASITAVAASCGAPTGGAGCGAVNVAGNAVTSTITTLPAGATVTFTITGTAPNSGTSVSNTATVGVPAGTTDSNPNNNTSTATTTLLQPQLSVAKTAAPNPFTVGQPASYTITVTNSGAGPTGSDITIADTLPAGVTLVSAVGTNWTCTGTTALSCTFTGTLAASASSILTLDVAVGASATTGDNSATASGGGDTSCPNAARCTGTIIVPVTPSADLSLNKSGPATVNSGGAISYTLLIANAGPSAADGASYDDAVPAAISVVAASCGIPTGGATCAAPNVAGNLVTGVVPLLPSGGSVTITITGTAPFGAQTLTNSATVNPPNGVIDPVPGNNSDSASTTIGNAADIAVTKVVDNTAPNVGDTVTFTITASNLGPDDATGIALTDSLPVGFGFVAATPSQGSYDQSTGLWAIGNLANGATVTLIIDAVIQAPGGLVNTVTVSAADQPDPDPSNNSAGAAVNSGASADIAVAKTVSNAAPNVGSQVTYTITATNNGPNDASGVEITDLLPAGVTFVSASTSQGAYDDVSGVWIIGALANATNATLAITVSVDAAMPILNSAAVTHSDQFDPVDSNNQAGVSINGQEADLAVTKTIDDSTPDIGDIVTFTITVHNNGPSDATNVELSDALPAGLAFDSASPSQGSYVGGAWTVGTLTASGSTSTATLTIAATVTQSGALTNTAAVSASDQVDPNPANNSASASLNGTALADLALTKSGPASVTPGGPVVYAIVVTNNGPSDAANVVVSDPTPAGLTFVGNTGGCTTAYPCALGTVPIGGSVTITTTYVVPFDYAGPDPIHNTASVSSDTTDPVPGNNQGSADTGVGQGSADLVLVKSGPATVVSGGAITWTLAISNTGPSPANDATYNDTLPTGITGVSASCGNEAGGAACVTQPTIAGSMLTGTIGTLPSGGSVLITIIATAPQGPVTLTNTAAVMPPASVTDPDPSNNSDTVSTGVGGQMANLSVDKTGPASATPGANVTYTLTVTNNGPDVATAVSLADPTPAGTMFVSASTPCAGGFPCALGDLPSGASTIVMVTFAVDAGASGTLVNTATGTSPTPDPDPSDNSDTVTIPIVIVAGSADLAVVKNGPAAATAGSNLTYTLTVTNYGPDAVPDAVISDPTPVGLDFVSASAPCTSGFPCSVGALAAGASAVITATYQVQAGYSGNIVNTANVGSATVPDPDPSNNTGTETTVVEGSPPPVGDITKVPVDARWMLALMALLLALVGAPWACRRH